MLFIVVNTLSYTKLVHRLATQTERNKLSIQHNRLKNPNWHEADGVVKLGSILRNNSNEVVSVWLELATSGFPVRYPNHSTLLSPILEATQIPIAT